ncbi:MAG TPA: RagB/SusD family nutrient uptake outer membrane protein, partial [Anseongella sp.]|nr:RagB/SusD family nutrient uptake outer membrane protein [Anseongella sp.]
IRVAKYPWYPSDDDNNRESDCVEMRLSEIYYMLAECRFRTGDIPEAGRLLNTVRKRNFPSSAWAASLYQPEGSIVLSEQELLDEWGREFLDEGRRRTDLIRFGVFASGEWWDKKPSQEFRNICPIPRDALNVNSLLKQNPGY